MNLMDIRQLINFDLKDANKSALTVLYLNLNFKMKVAIGKIANFNQHFMKIKSQINITWLLWMNIRKEICLKSKKMNQYVVD